MKTFLISVLFLITPLVAFADVQWKWFTLPSGVSWYAPQQVEAEELSLKDQILYWIDAMANKYGASARDMKKVINCETQFNINAQGDWRSEAGIFLSNGIAQFQKPTFLKFQNESGIQGDYPEWKPEIELMAWAFSHNLQRHWLNCSKWTGVI